MFMQDELHFENEYYTYNIRFLKLIGISPYETLSYHMFHICLFNFIIAISSFSHIFLLFTSEMKIDPITKILETTLPTLCFTLCYYNLLSKIKRLLLHIKTDWNSMTSKPELMILKKYANRSRQCTIIIAIAFYMYIGILIFPSVIRIILCIFGELHATELVLPISINYFLINQEYLYFVLFIEYATLIVLSTIGIAHFSIFVSLVQHSCALFNIVAWKIEDEYKKNSHNFYHADNYDKEYKSIIDIIEYYDNAIYFVDLIKLYHGRIYLSEIFFALFFIIVNYIYLFQILSFTINVSDVLQKVNYIFGSMFVIYVYHYLGQKLINHHTEIYIKLCQIPFYLLSLKTQKMLLFLIMKSMMPCNLSIKRMIVLSHDLFATVLYSHPISIFQI
ncbi:uncharacterized protein LOC124957229 [Vespa velutina]|uniref:uncharacterized protein LOC124957229 n=1 Tax=Vespa velutina TaxID=202808 RepID=UPI001FB1B45C|nr:uncharacterized protein LOC124957229 [Vespa velutina]